MQHAIDVISPEPQETGFLHKVKGRNRNVGKITEVWIFSNPQSNVREASVAAWY